MGCCSFFCTCCRQSGGDSQHYGCIVISLFRVIDRHICMSVVTVRCLFTASDHIEPHRNTAEADVTYDGKPVYFMWFAEGGAK